ncbi:hypothetical protein GCM10025870_06080 [Agromyces marinus]|uniref:NAD(P)-binding domain-containing protein n=1 Tax=Agromyces marinus TaxID=1389020 RepID=A0ABM8GYJ0_9MICO|nr:hypothetical protein GCM10025870_06080 [Agromyces marinus]
MPRLVEAGHEVRAIVRRPERLRTVPWARDVEVVGGDLTDAAAVDAAMRGIDTVYYLVHSMGGRGDFEDVELEIAGNVAESARRSGVGRIVYLGGLHPGEGELSRHLRSRVRVGEVLMSSGVPTIVLQAGVIIGSGSTSFEMIRHLTEVLPYMPAPRWVRNFIQPIAVRDVLHYLVAAARVPERVNRTFDIGGPDVLRYGQLMNGYAVEAGLRQRPIAALPVLTPWLAGQWVNLVTPIPRRLAVPIIESLQFDCVARDHDIDRVIPPPAGGLTPYRRAVRLALERERAGEVETSWQNTEVVGAPSDPLPSDPEWAGYRVYTDVRERECSAPAASLWSVIEGVGGTNGWYSFPSPGRSAGGSTSWRAASACGGAGATRRGCGPGTRWTSGGSSGSRRPGIGRASSGCGPRCAFQGVPGSRCPPNRRGRARATGSGRSSSRAGSPAGCTGGRCSPSTGSSSPGWPTGSRRRPRRARPRRARK